MKQMKNNQNLKDKTVVIKLKQWQIPYLLGACSLGVILQRWCAYLEQIPIETYDGDSARWTGRVDNIVGQIQKQTDIKKPNLGHGENERILEMLFDYVMEQCKQLKPSNKRKL